MSDTLPLAGRTDPTPTSTSHIARTKLAPHRQAVGIRVGSDRVRDRAGPSAHLRHLHKSRSGCRTRPSTRPWTSCASTGFRAPRCCHEGGPPTTGRCARAAPSWRSTRRSAAPTRPSAARSGSLTSPRSSPAPRCSASTPTRSSRNSATTQTSTPAAARPRSSAAST